MRQDHFSPAVWSRGIAIEAKTFFRRGQNRAPAEAIDRAMYGDYAGHPKLGHAEYQLSERETDTGRAVYTFCMCPGGVVVPAASERETIVTNGMSYHSRDGKNANAALVVSVDHRDYGSNPLDGVWFQQAIERRAYAAVGDYHAPAQTVGCFMQGVFRGGVGQSGVDLRHWCEAVRLYKNTAAFCDRTDEKRISDI